MSSASRIRAVFLAACLSLGLLVARLFTLQIVQGRRYLERADNQIRTLELIPARRGAILDRNGVPLARDEARYRLRVVLPDLRDAPQVFENLARVLGAWGPATAQEELSAALHRAEAAADTDVARAAERMRAGGAALRPRQEERLRRRPQPFLDDVSHRAASFILARPDHFPGILVSTEAVRRYPQGTLAGSLLGYLGMLQPEELESLDRQGLNLTAQLRRYPREWVYSDPGIRRRGFFQDEWIGRSGLERIHEERLRGARGARLVERRVDDPRAGTDTDPHALLGMDPPASGEDVTLTLDARIQQAAEGALADPLRNRKGAPGAVVVLDPTDGAILALASHPPFDPSRRTGRGEFPRAIAGLYPLGSVAKVVVAAAFLEEGAGPAGEELPCAAGLFRVGTHVFGCSHEHGACDVARALEVSCNNYFYGAALRLHRKGADLGAWASRMGLGFPATSPRPGEPSPGDVVPADPTGRYPTPRSPADALNLAIGQGTCLATPLQAARMMACIANGRGRVTPHLEGARALPPQPLPLSPGTLRAIREGLARVPVSGTAAGQGLDALRVAGKTGTAQTGRTGEPHAWFVGYAPADAPRVVVAVLLENAGTGGEEAGPVAEAVFSRALAVLQGDSP